MKFVEGSGTISTTLAHLIPSAVFARSHVESAKHVIIHQPHSYECLPAQLSMSQLTFAHNYCA